MCVEIGCIDELLFSSLPVVTHSCLVPLEASDARYLFETRIVLFWHYYFDITDVPHVKQLGRPG